MTFKFLPAHSLLQTSASGIFATENITGKKNVSQFTSIPCTPAGPWAPLPKVWAGRSRSPNAGAESEQRQLHPHPSVLTAFKHFQYVGSSDNLHCMENKVEGNDYWHCKGGSQISTDRGEDWNNMVLQAAK